MVGWDFLGYWECVLFIPILDCKENIAYRLLLKDQRFRTDITENLVFCLLSTLLIVSPSILSY